MCFIKFFGMAKCKCADKSTLVCRDAFMGQAEEISDIQNSQAHIVALYTEH